MPKILGLEPESDNLRNLDFLRIVASLGILVYHSEEFFYAPQERPLLHVRTDGLGFFLDLFFFISGFVMGFVYDGRIRSVGTYFSFVWRRIARLYPLHLLVLALNIGVWTILLTRGHSASAPPFTARCIVYEALLLHAYLYCGSTGYFNGVTWTIGIEMGLYLALLPLLMWIGRRGIGWLAAACLAAIVLAVAKLPTSEDSIYTWAHLPGIVRGVVSFSLGYLAFKGRGYLPKISGLGTLVPYVCAVAFAEMVIGAPQALLLATMIALAALAFAADTQGQVHPLVERLCPFGQLTYSIYIWHRVIVLVLLNVVADKLFHGNVAMLVAMSIATVVAIFLASYSGYFLIEVPARRWLIGLLRPADDPVAEARARTPGL